VSSVFVGDALLDPDPTTDDAFRQKVEASHQECIRALGSYLPVTTQSDEPQRIANLRTQIDGFYREMFDVLATDTSEWPRDALRLLQERVDPRRDAVVQLSEQVEALNRSAFVQHQIETSQLNDVTQRSEWERLSLALFGIVGIGLLATFYAARLERRVHRQQLRDRKTAAELHRLSSRLVRAQEDERSLIARELHDEVGQALTAAKMELSLASRMIGHLPDAASRVAEARRMVEDTVRAVRDLSHLLHPALLDDLGLIEALRQQLDGFARRHDVKCTLAATDGRDRLAPELDTALYRIVQEALNNIAKHAHATRCRVSLEDRDATVFLTIEDDGVGFDAAGFDGPGLGLVGIRQRVAQCGGTFHLTTAPGKGTRLEIVLPARLRPRPSPEDPDPVLEHSLGEAANFSR
jgi:signal transduction histidine kinase